VTAALEALRAELVSEPLQRLSLLGARDRACLEPVALAELDVLRHGDLPRWAELLLALPSDRSTSCALDQDVVTVTGAASAEPLREALLGLAPWRKGPFDVRGVHIDAEWRSNLKWDRLRPALDWTGRSVLDVGSGNGYYALRAVGAGASHVVGIDPAVLACVQFAAVTRGCDLPAVVLPLRLEDLPPLQHRFDVVVSAGVLGHRRDPLDHLRRLRPLLAADGTLLLDTLVIRDRQVETARSPEDEAIPEQASDHYAPDYAGVFRPGGRYAAMRNVYLLPTVPQLLDWLERTGFVQSTLLDESVTTRDEQRTTSWMPWQSLGDFLAPHDLSQTIEGHPAPCRAVVRARRSR
jgi:tRNA (mo5U34)-methyltransferase